MKNETRTILIYEAPHHLIKTLEILYEALGERRITVCRELTKKHETIFLTTFKEALAYYETTPPKGECVIVIEGRSYEEIEKEQQSEWQQLTLEEHMQLYLDQGADRKAAMKLVAKDRGISRRDVYQALMK